jgi:hypothetical protein
MDNEPIFYGYGWLTNKVNGKQFIHHGGSLPGFKSVYFRYIEDKTAIIILTNSDYADAYGIAFGVSDLLREEDKKKQQPTAGTSQTRTILSLNFNGLSTNN